jgi:hypothetical protein
MLHLDDAEGNGLRWFGLRQAVVKPLWGEEVTVTGIQKGKKIHLM